MSEVLKQKVIRNTLSCGASGIVIILINFLLMPFMISKLGVLEYGLIEMAVVFMLGGYMSLFEMGFQTSITKYVAEYNKKNEYLKIAQLINTALVIFLLIGLVLMLLGISISGLIVRRLFKIPLEYHSSFRGTLLFVFISYIFLYPNFVILGFLEGMQRFDILRGIQVVATILYACGVVLLLQMRSNYLSIVILRTCILISQCIFLLFIVLNNYKFVKIKSSYFSFRSIKDVGRMTKFLFIGKISSLLFHSAPKIIIGVFLGPISMTFYEAVNKISRAIKTTLGFLNSAIMPAASELFADKKISSLRKLFLKTSRYQLFALLPIATGTMFLARILYKVWLGPEFIKLAPLLWIALTWNLIIPFITIGGSILIGMNRQLRYLTFLSVVNTFLNIVIIVALVQRFELLSIFLGIFLSTFITLLFYFKLFFREFALDIKSFFKELVIILGLGTAPLIFSYVASRVMIHDSYLFLFFKGFIWCSIYWILLYKFVLDSEDKNIFKNLKKMLCPT